jgi:hypothetical protein
VRGILATVREHVVFFRWASRVAVPVSIVLVLVILVPMLFRGLILLMIVLLPGPVVLVVVL